MRIGLCSGSDVLARDKFVIQETGVPSIVLMEQAGSAVAAEVRRIMAPAGGRIAVLSGSGNNGADGLVVARQLSAAGYGVDVYLVDGEKAFRSDEGRQNRNLLEKYNQQVFTLPCIVELDQYRLIVDAVLGAGTSTARQPEDRLDNLFIAVNKAKAQGALVVSVDVPSGIDPSTGAAIYGNPVRTDVTVTFGIVKTGLVVYPGKALAGRLVLATISYPPQAMELPRPVTMWMNPIPQLPTRSPEGHKGRFGKAAFVAGSGQYFGAPMLSAMSFLRAGGGYAKLFTVEEVGRVVAVSAPEVVMVTDPLASVANNDVVVIGPGIGLDENARLRFRRAIEQVCDSESAVHTVVIDGDGLTLLAERLVEIVRMISARGINVVLTPHRGEWHRLFGPCQGGHVDLVKATEDFLANLVVATELVVVIKGASTAVVSNKGQTWINPTGNSGMGTCGSGDVLAGILAALLCAFREDTEALLSAVGGAVFLHGLAGDLAANAKGEDGLIASDIMDNVPAAIQQVRNHQNELRSRYFPSVV